MLLDPRHPGVGRLIAHDRTAGAALLVGVLLVGVLLVGILATASPAAAHNGRTAFTGVFGPYDVVASVRYVHDGDRGVLLDLLVRTEGARRPVEDASVQVEGRAGTRTVGPLDAARYGNTYRVVLPGGDVDAWEVETSIDGEPGASTFTRTVPGPAELRSDAGGHTAGSTGAAWAVAGALGLLIGVAGLTRWWRPAMWAAGGALLATCGTALVGHVSGADAPAVARVAALPAPLVAAGLLLAGLVMSRRRSDESLVLVFLGAAGSAVLLLWLGHSALTGTLAVGLGGGLVLLVVACHRDKLRALVSPARPGP